MSTLQELALRELDERLRDLGWDDRELARRAHINPQTLRQLREKAAGRAAARGPRLATMAKLSTALGYPEYFLWVCWWTPGEQPVGTKAEEFARLKAAVVDPPESSAAVLAAGTMRVSHPRATPAELPNDAGLLEVEELPEGIGRDSTHRGADRGS
ncbi:hypothetical protein ACFFX1_49360, partial [Dactylosporangium sucinum]